MEVAAVEEVAVAVAGGRKNGNSVILYFIRNASNYCKYLFLFQNSQILFEVTYHRNYYFRANTYLFRKWFHFLLSIYGNQA